MMTGRAPRQLGGIVLLALVSAGPGAAQNGPAGVFAGSAGVLSRDVAGEAALFGEWVGRTGGTFFHVRASYAASVVVGGDGRHAGLLRDPGVHGQSTELGAGHVVPVGRGFLVAPYVEAGVNFADWAAAAPATRREAAAVLFAGSGVRGVSPDLAGSVEQEVRVAADVAVVGRWIRSGVGKSSDLRLLLLGSDRRDFAGLGLGVSVETALVKPRVRLTWFPPEDGATVPGLTETRLSLDVEIRARLF